MDLQSIRSTLEDYYTLRPKGICYSVKQVYFHSTVIQAPFFDHLNKNKGCSLKQSPVTYFRVKTPTDCTQQDCSGCEHLLSNTNKGGKNCMSLLIC